MTPDEMEATEDIDLLMRVGMAYQRAYVSLRHAAWSAAQCDIPLGGLANHTMHVARTLCSDMEFIGIDEGTRDLLAFGPDLRG